jgi:hypothetical protein
VVIHTSYSQWGSPSIFGSIGSERTRSESCSCVIAGIAEVVVGVPVSYLVTPVIAYERNAIIFELK